VGKGELLGKAIDVVEEAIRLVLMLLLQLVLVNAFVIKGLARGRGDVGNGGRGLEWASYLKRYYFC